MTLTINLDEALTVQLRKQAAARHLALEEFAAHLLGEAVARLESPQQWEQHNQRRLALIRKSSSTLLSAEEAAELDDLQAALDRRLEPVDDRLLAALERMQHAVDALPADAKQ